MANQIGIATGPNDLLDKLRTWLLTDGWTSDSYTTEGSGYRFHAHKGSTYLNLRSFNNEFAWGTSVGTGSGICLNLGTGYSSGGASSNQPGVPLASDGVTTMGCSAILGNGPFASHQFFSDGNGNYLVMVERSPGVWRHLCWGSSLDKSGAGTWTGGAYFSSCSPSNFSGATMDPGTTIYTDFPPMPNFMNNGPQAFVRADVDTFTGKWLALGVSTTGKTAQNGLVCEWPCGATEIPKYGVDFRNRLYSSQDSRGIMLPMMIFGARDAGGYSFLGTVPSLMVSATHLHGLAIGQDMTVGAETWRQFNGFLVKVVP